MHMICNWPRLLRYSCQSCKPWRGTLDHLRVVGYETAVRGLALRHLSYNRIWVEMGQKTISGHNFDALRANRDNPTAALVLEDGTVFTGFGFGAATTNVGEVCFNTSMTGYQEIMTDPSYAGQIITLPFPTSAMLARTAKILKPIPRPHLAWLYASQ